MTQMAHNNSKLVVITSDNLRNENFNHIVDDMMEGIYNNRNIIIEADRKVAIIYALEHACHGDVVLILGKGHEEFQIIRDVKYHNSDIEIVEEWINK
jgi:UDP-N-acetylmuramoyl-L-alanyl-D-glutamate--2,6-diaminopimelate ligase